jgi:hypothetical protein
MNTFEVEVGVKFTVFWVFLLVIWRIFTDVSKKRPDDVGSEIV